MEDRNRSKFKNNFLYWALFVYAICVLAIPNGGGLNVIRIPSFSLLLLILAQVIFPQFRFSQTANIVAVIVIIGLGFASTLTIAH
ncbi:MAG: hypothetical protein ACI9NQ_002112 [Paracoccaceae bacterium]|jgi:hypothetical protein